MSITFTVFFDRQFWVGVFERQEDGECCAAKVVFGAEPKEEQLLDWISCNFYRLRFSPGVIQTRVVKLAENPKRRQRQAEAARSAGIGTKSQQAMKLAHEENKKNRHACARELRTTQEQKKLLLHIEKKKAKHRGH